MKFKILALAGLVFLGGCESLPYDPTAKAAYMLNQDISEVKNAISNHESRMPGDRNRWQESDIVILQNLYARLDDLYRQKQILAAEAGSQKYDPKVSLPQVPNPTSKANR